MNPPKPASRPDKVSLWRYLRLFRQDILSAQPQRLYRAWMAEFKTPFFRSYLLNQPQLIDIVLRERPMDFPKSNRIAEGLRPLLGNSVFLTNGETWKRQRRIIDPAFEGGRLRAAFGSVADAGEAAVKRLQSEQGPLEFEAVTSHLAADVIFRSLFSIPISHDVAAQVFAEFKEFQRSQPIVNPAALVPMPRWIPRLHRRKTRAAAKRIRALIGNLTAERAGQIAQGSAPDDLATKIMTTPDPETGQVFDTGEMIDQVAIFFLAGHETSASALSWALYLLALYPEAQDRVADEAAGLSDTPDFSELSKLRFTRDVFRETLRLYPPVPMMVREATGAENFRDRDIAKGAQLVISPWHLHRHERLWDEPNAFDPDRFSTAAGKASAQSAYIPFSAGARVCTGAGFAMMEGTLLLALLVRSARFSTVPGKTPVPVAHLTVRSKDGIWLTSEPR
ncbi:MAG: cytochrome P450 [Marinosulfonomonas sp.]|nr:cytochrome P450 [Marinosulfonomonas sp.]